MVASRTAIATTGHNIANANTEGYTRQRVQTATDTPRPAGSRAFIGTGALISRVDRVNDGYIEKQVRNAGRDLAHMEEKDTVLRQTEEIFNEMNGEGLNRLVARFFNEFRKLSNEPDSEAVRQSVREASQALVNDFHRLRSEVEDVRKHIDARLEGHAEEVNALARDLNDMNIRIRTITLGGGEPNDLFDKRDVIVKKLAGHLDLNVHTDNDGNYVVEMKGVGPLVVGGHVTEFAVHRAPADERGKPEGALDISSSGYVGDTVTHQLRGGKMGALLEVRDRTLSTILSRLDELAHNITLSVNEVHQQGFTRDGLRGLSFFRPLGSSSERASEFIQISDDIQANVNNIAAAATPDAPGDNRIAIAISGLQGMRIMNNGKATMDDWYNSIVSEVGVAAARNRSGMNQQKDIVTHLNKMREQLSGVSIDEETANLMQFQHAFDASAKVIQVADEMLKTVLEIKR